MRLTVVVLVVMAADASAVVSKGTGGELLHNGIHASLGKGVGYALPTPSPPGRPMVPGNRAKLQQGERRRQAALEALRKRPRMMDWYDESTSS